MKKHLIILKIIFAVIVSATYLAVSGTEFIVKLIVVLLLAVIYIALTVLEHKRIKDLEEETEHKLSTSDTLVDCIRVLSDDRNADTAMDDLLKVIAEYYKADRAFIFEIDYEEESTSNTYEYAAENVTKEIEKLQDVPIESIDCFLKMFKEKGTFFISDIDEDVEKGSSTYEILAMQKVHRLIAVPIIENDEIIGFMGVDNPTENYHDFSLLSSASFFILENVEKRKRQEELERMSYQDGLTKLFNRNKFNRIIAEYTEKVPSALGIAYFDLNGLKVMNDEYGHGAGDRFILNAASTIKYVFEGDSYRIGGDEFAVICADMSEEEFMTKLEEEKKHLWENEISVSIGHSWRGADNDINAQLREADNLMYENKREFYERSGKDRRRR
jgi:diguanylate cyclase (GGDEF)-like protein